MDRHADADANVCWTFAGSCPTKQRQCPAGWHPGEVGTQSKCVKHIGLCVLGNTGRTALSWMTMPEGRWPVAGSRGRWSTVKGGMVQAQIMGDIAMPLWISTHQSHSRYIQ